MQHQKIDHPSQAKLREQHAELLADIAAVAERANEARRLRADPQRALGIVQAAEVAHVRVADEWRKSRGGNQNNLFFGALSKRLRRIIAYYRHGDGKPPEPAPSGQRWVYRIIDYEAIPFHRLRPYFRASAVDEAIKTGIGLGLRELGGVLIYQENPDE
jgi:hypothetical protein